MTLEAKKLGFYHKKDQWLFKEIDLEVAPGQILGIFGQSGCGKTSLSRVLAGFLQPKSGEVLVDGSHLPNKAFRPVQLIQQHPEQTMNPLWPMKKKFGRSLLSKSRFARCFWHSRKMAKASS